LARKISFVAKDFYNFAKKELPGAGISSYKQAESEESYRTSRNKRNKPEIERR
jgi:hypothetical protein